MELKHCPLCGSAKIASYEYHGFRWKVCCEACAAQIYRGTQKDAENAWNRRANDV